MPTGIPKSKNAALYASVKESKSPSIEPPNAKVKTSTESKVNVTDFLGNKPGLGTESQLDQQDIKGILAHRFLSALLDDVIMDTTFEAHKKETKKRRQTCPVCNSLSCRSTSRSSSSTPQPQPHSQNSQPSNQPTVSQAVDAATDTTSKSSESNPQSLEGESLASEVSKPAVGTNGSSSTTNLNSTSNSISSETQILLNEGISTSNSAPQSQISTPEISTPPPSQPISNSAPSSTSKPLTTNGNSNTTSISNSNSNSNATDYYSHNPLFECLVCTRQVSSNRYAPHLAKCLGLGSNSSSKTSSSRKSKGSADSKNAAALAFSRGQKVASALENRKKAMGMSTIRNSSGEREFSDDDKIGNGSGSGNDSSSSNLKKKTLGDSLGLGLNKFGKRALSPNFGVGKGNWKRNKNKTATPPPTSSSSSINGVQDSSDPNNGVGMIRSQSASGQLSSISSQPFSHSPLNPNKYNNNSNGKDSDPNNPSSNDQNQDNISPSKGGDNSVNGNARLGKEKDRDEDMEDFSDSQMPSSGSGLLNNGRQRKKHAKEGYSDEESSMLSNSNSFSSGEGSSGSEVEDISSTEEESSEDEENDEMEDDFGNSLQQHGKVGITYGKNDGNKSNSGENGMLERSRGSDGEFIGVDSASEQDDDDEDF